jgi:peptide/nickel transport system permease protein
MKYVLGRILQAVPVLLLASVIVFMLVQFAAGDPVRMALGLEASPEAIASMRHRLGLDQPLWVQYVGWLTGVLHGDFGTSILNSFPVAVLLQQRFPATLMLALVAICFSVMIALPLGVFAALARGRLFDRLVTTLTSVAIAVPHFWLGILFILVFAVQLGWFPAGGYTSPVDSPARFANVVFLPALTLSLYVAAALTRFIRTSLVDVLQVDYIRTARSKGLGPRAVVIVHALRNALIPAVTVLGVQFGRLLAGTIIVEAVFSWPGLGQLMLSAINNRDAPVVQGVFLLFVVLVVFSNLATDILYSVIDPRIRIDASRR